MKIKGIAINGYRNLQNIQMDFEDGLTVIVGKNDSGKSNIIRFVDFCLGFFNLDDRGQIISMGGGGSNGYQITKTNIDDFRLFIGDKPGTINAQLIIELSEDELKRLFHPWVKDPHVLTKFDPDNLRTISISFKLEGKTIDKQNTLEMEIIRIMSGDKLSIFEMNEESKAIRALIGFSNLKPQYAGDVGILSQLFAIISTKEREQLLIIPAERTIIPAKMSDLETEDSKWEELDARKFVGRMVHHIGDLRLAKRGIHDLIQEDMRILFPDYKELKIHKDGHEVSDAYLDRYPSSQIGSGIKQVLECLLTIRLSSSNILAIEEPEIHLHPDKQREFYAYLKAMMGERQLIITTHSPTIVADSPIDSLRLIKKEGGSMKIYKFEGQSDLSKIASEIGILPRDIFDFESLIIVEDEASKIFFEAAIKEIGIPQGRITVIQVGSWSWVSSCANAMVLKKLKRKFIAVFDGDVESVPSKKKMRDKFLLRSGLTLDNCVSLKRPNIEHYFAIPDAIISAYPDFNEASIKEILVNSEGKQDLKNEFKAIFNINDNRGYSLDDLSRIVGEFSIDDFPEDIKKIISNVQ